MSFEEDYSDAGSAYYKAKVRIGKHSYKLKVLPDGTLLKMKLKEEEHGDHEDGDHDHAENNHGDRGHAEEDHGGLMKILTLWVVNGVVSMR